MKESQPEEASEGVSKSAVGDAALLPRFDTHVNASITLYAGRLEAVGLLEGDGLVSFDWLPTPRVKFRVIATTDKPVDISLAVPPSLVLKDRHAETTGKLTGSRISGGPGGVTQALDGVLDRTILGEHNLLPRLLFHVPNLPAFAGGRLQREDAQEHRSWFGRLRMDDGVWQVTIDPVEDHRELIEQLTSVGGYALTAVGDIRRLDGGAFSMDDASELLGSLRLFLSLLSGRWTDAFLRIGLSPDDRPISEEWYSPIVDPWSGRRSVFPEHVLEGDRIREPRLRPVFQTLMKYRSEATWSDVVVWGISWLIESDRAVNADTSVVLSQAGLELLAWAQLVLGDGMSPRQFKDLEAHVALAGLFEAIGIPTVFPNGTMLDEMYAFASDERVQAPEAFTRVRNHVVHPRHGENRPSRGLRIEAAQIGLWYLQLAILHLLNYDDVHLNRLRSWHPERVPWA
jgi:hypothetical protein